MASNPLIAGVGMIPFAKPGRSDSYDRMGCEAARRALADAGIPYSAVQQAYVGYVLGSSTSGQQALYPLGLTGIPIINVNNTCATGSTALYLARQAVESGQVEVALALGFEEMRPGALGGGPDGRKPVMEMHARVLHEAVGEQPDVMITGQYFGGAGREYADRYGTRPETFAKIAVKARRHALRNPHAVFREPVSIEQVLASPSIFGPLTRLQCCPPTCGAAAAIVVSPEFARRHSISGVEIAAQVMTTDDAAAFANNSMIRVIGYDMARNAASEAYRRAGIGPEEIDVVELHDCFTTNELLSYEALGLTPEGTAERFVEDNDNTYGGRYVVNPSGGLLSKGHPLGATGLAQCAELVWQLRGQAEDRQVEGARIGLQHNLGLGGACVVTLYRRVAA